MTFGIDDAIGAGLAIINKFIPDGNAKAAAEAEYRLAVLTAANKAESDQRDINKTEAASNSLFVAGWRPAVGWLCVFTLAYSWVLAPFVSWCLLAWHPGFMPLPVLGNEASQTLLYALLGIGSLRTIDKATGNATGGILGGLLGGKK